MDPEQGQQVNPSLSASIRQVLRRVPLWLALFLAVAAALALLVLPRQVWAEPDHLTVAQSLWIHLADRFGEALLVAVFLGVTVDVYLKWRLAEDVAKDVSSYVLANWLPPALRSEVQNICQTGPYRENLRIRYRLIELADSKHVILHTRTTYRYRNPSDVTKRIQHQITVQKHFISVEEKVGLILNVGARNVRDPDTDEPLCYDFPADGPLEPAADGPFDVSWGRWVGIPPTSGLSENDLPEFWAESEQIFPLEHFDLFVSMRPTVGVAVEAEYPEKFKLRVFIGHRQNPVETPPGRPTIWELRGVGLLPNAPITIEWRCQQILDVSKEPLPARRELGRLAEPVPVEIADEPPVVPPQIPS